MCNHSPMVAHKVWWPIIRTLTTSGESSDLIASIISSDESAMLYSGHLHAYHLTVLTGTATRYSILAGVSLDSVLCSFDSCLLRIQVRSAYVCLLHFKSQEF